MAPGVAEELVFKETPTLSQLRDNEGICIRRALKGSACTEIWLGFPGAV